MGRREAYITGMTALLAVAILALIVFTVSMVYAVRAAVSYMNDSSMTTQRPDSIVWCEAFEARTLDEFKRLKAAIAEGIERVERAEKRVQKTVASARRLVKANGLEHPGLEAEADELRERDGEGIEPLPAVPKEVEAVRTIRIPGGQLTLGV